MHHFNAPARYRAKSLRIRAIVSSTLIASPNFTTIACLGPQSAYMGNIMCPLVISLLPAGAGWTVVWSDGKCLNTHSFVRQEEATKFFEDLSSKNPRAVRIIEGMLQ